VPINPIRVYHLVDIDDSETGKGAGGSSEKVVPITRE
jgi:hypothetical protein